MSLCARLDAVTNRLSDIGNRDPGPSDVPLVAMPAGYGPFAYDAVNQIAVPVAGLPSANVAAFTQNEKLDRAGLPLRVLAALTLRMSASWATLPSTKQTQIQAILDSAATQIIAALT
jgi:hypothetical protein